MTSATRWKPTSIATLLLVAALATAPGPTASTAASSSHRIAHAIRHCTNRARDRHDLPRLRGSGGIDRAARYHARDMARYGFFSHVDPWGHGPAERVHMFTGHRFTYIGENIAAGYPTAHAACGGWMRGAGHRRNMLSARYTYIGTGVARGGLYGSVLRRGLRSPGEGSAESSSWGAV